MQLVPIEDIDFFAKQSSGKLNMIISGMTALMNDNESKVSQLESQNWFQRMVRTVTGKNKATREEIQRNHDRINAYMSEALAELYNRNMIDHQIILSLGTQINELYADHIQLKQMLGAFALKLNEKIESVDNFHMLMEEISQGVYSSGHSLVEICKVISQLDHRTLSDGRKLDIVRRGLVSQGILSDEPRSLKDYLLQVAEIPSDEAGRIYLELGTLRSNFMADIILAMMDDYHFLPDMARKMKSKPAMIAGVIEAGRLDEGVTLSTSEIYDDFINSKIDAVNGLVPVVMFDENTEDLDEIRRAAEAGIPEAQDKLGDMYCSGDGVEQDYVKAVEWYRKAAEQGDAAAQNDLGFMYYAGQGVEQDYVKAVEWLRKSAEQDYDVAQTSLGSMYYCGYGVEQDYTKAVEWYRKAAKQGYDGAQNEMGNMYYRGHGVEQDYTKAAEWYRKTAEQGNASAQNELGDMYFNGRGVEKNRTKAVEWWLKAAEQGDTEAQNKLGNAYRMSWGVEQDYEEAVKWYHKAAEQGHIRAQSSLGFMYRNGYGVEKNYTEAVKWFRKAAEHGDSESQFNLAELYRVGKGVEQDYTKAREW